MSVWAENNRERFRELNNKYMRSEKGRAVNQRANVKYRAKNITKTRAHTAVRDAVRRGDISAPTRCDECSEEKRLHAHHDNYLYPLDIRWLCSPCHQEWHDNNEALS